MLRLDDEKKPETTSPSISPIEITPLLINHVINVYAALTRGSWEKSIYPKFISSKFEKNECATITQLRGFISLSIEESKLLNTTQLFHLASILAPALKSKDKILTEAIAPLITTLGKNRITATKILKKMSQERNIELFDSLCRIPDNRVKIVAGVYSFENEKVKMSPETIELFVKHSDRCEKILEFQKLDRTERRKKVKEIFGKLSLDATTLIFLSNLLNDKNKMENVTVNLLANQLISGALKHDENMIDVLYAILWLENHNINTKENDVYINEHPTELNYLPQIGFSSKKTENKEFNQRLFLFAVQEGAKKNIASETKPAIENTVTEIPALTKSPSK